MRILLQPLFRRRNAGFLQQPDGALARFFGTDRQVREDGFGELPADGVQRVQRGQRVLEDGADAPAADGAHLLVREVVDALSGQTDLAAGDAPRRFEQADDGRAGERLAGAGFADHAEHLARRDVEGDVVQREQRAAARWELDAQVPDLQQRRSHAAPWGRWPVPPRGSERLRNGRAALISAALD